VAAGSGLAAGVAGRVEVADFGSVGSVGVPVAGGVAPGSVAVLFPAVVTCAGVAAVVRVGWTVAGPGLGVVGLAAPGAKVASGPQTPSITESHGVAGAAGEQSRAAAEVDDNAAGVEHDPTDVTAEGGGEHVDRIDLVTGGSLAAAIVDGCGIEWFDVDTSQRVEVVFEGLLVDDDVDQRIEGADRAGSGGCLEDRQQGIEASLGIGAFQQSGHHRLAVLGDTCIPVGVELGVAEPLEDLLDLRSGTRENSSNHNEPA
jgi:hypothetical protein